MNNIYKKLSVILMFLSMIGCFNINLNMIFAVDVDTSTSGGGNKHAQGCSNTNCYSLGTGGVRLRLLSADGQQRGNTVEYWYYNSNVPFIEVDANNIVYFDKKYLKQDLIEKDSTAINSYVKIGNSNSYSVKSIESVAPGILTGMNSKFHWKDEIYGIYNCSGTNSVSDDSECEVGTKANTRVANVTERIINRLVANGKGVNYKNEENYGSKKLLYIDNILKDMGLTNGIDDLKENEYLQLEPVTQWGNLRLSSSCGYNNVAFMGTPTEFSVLIKAIIDGKFYYSSDNDNKLDTGNGGVGYVEGGKGYICAFNANNTKHYFELSTIGIFTSKSDNMPSIGFSSVSNVNLTSIGAKDMYGNMKSAYGVGFISLKEFSNKKCSEQVVNLINQNKFASGIDNVIKKYPKAEWLQSYKDYGFKDLSSLKDYLNTKTDKSCPPPSCNETASNYLKGGSTKGDLVTILSNTIKNLYNELQKNLKNDEVFIYKTYTLNGSYYSDKYCEIVSCSDLLKGHTSDETYLAKLYNLFPKFTALSKDLRDAMDGTLEPSCVSTPSCPVEPVTAKCDSNNSFTLQDTNLEKDMAKTDNSKKCLQNGYAYNDTDSNGNVIANTVQTSFDSEYGTSSNPGYCWESVKFNFPNSVTNITASTIFKWSTNGNSYNAEDNLFGTMTVTRKCYLSKDYFSVKGKTIYSNWASMVDSGREGARISPEITINYSEAIPNNLSKKYERLELKDNLNVSLSKFDMYINGKENNYGTDNNHVTYTDDNENYDVSQYVNNNPRSYTCGTLGNDCSKVKYVEMEATYNLTYGDEFRWYSNRSEKDATTSMSKIPDDVKEKYEEKDGILGPYRFIGYGLPTSFITPTNLAGKYDYGYELSTATGNGNLYAEVAHIGTRNKNGDTYHFDKMVKFAITDDDDNTNDKIVYSCGFDINNRIFGNEDEPCEEGKCDMPKGLDVVFRTIDLMDNSTKEELDRAFPGMSGTGRTMGANWSEIYDIEDPDEGAANIFSVLDSSIYSKEPMYHITLDVALIKEIRTLNDKVKGDPYSDKTEVTTDKAKDGEAGYYFGDLNEYGGGIRSLFLSYLYNNGELETSCIKSNKDNGGNERNSDCFKSLVID